MIEIGGLRVQESWTEYAVEVEPGLTVECDDLAEAQTIAANFGAKVLRRRGFLTEWAESEQALLP